MNHRRAFTLFELLLSIALLSALVFTLLPASLRVIESTANAKQRSKRFTQLSILADVMDRSLMTLVAVDEDGGPGFASSSSGIQMVTCGVSLQESDSESADDLQLVEMNHSGSQLRIRVRGGAWQVLLDRVEKVEFSNFDGDSWQDVDGQSASIPAAVAVSIWFGEETAQEEDDPHAMQPIESEETAPDWRRVFSTLDSPGAPASSGGDA